MVADVEDAWISVHCRWKDRRRRAWNQDELSISDASVGVPTASDGSIDLGHNSFVWNARKLDLTCTLLKLDLTCKLLKQQLPGTSRRTKRYQIGGKSPTACARSTEKR